MNVLLDMNLSPTWVSALQAEGMNVVHWQDLGAKTAEDRNILSWARDHGHIVLTLDLDFQQLLFATRAQGPSVVLARSRSHVARAPRQSPPINIRQR